MQDDSSDYESANDEGTEENSSVDTPDTEEAPSSEADDKELLARAHANFKIAQNAEKDIREEALEDYKFRAGEQWPEDIINARNQDHRPCLTINRIPQFVNQVINDIRQNRPSIMVSAMGNGANVDTAEVFEGLIRHIEYKSSADVAYDNGVEGQVTGGFGFWRVVTEYESPNSFNLEPRIKRVRNPFSVLLDPSYAEPDGSDANFGHVFDDISKAEFRALYPDSKMSQMADWDTLGANAEGWVSTDGCRISEYFERTWDRKKLFLLTNGDSVLEENLDQLIDDPNIFATDEKGEKVFRETLCPKVMWYKINAVEVLDRSEFPCKWIPIIPALGTEMIIEGERILEGVVRHARDPQRMYNFWATAETEMIALAPKAPFIAAAGQLEGHEDKWQSANIRNHPFLEYNPTSSDGKPCGPPTRNTYEPPVQAITNARMASAEDLKATTGIYDASLGQRSNEQSGVAIQRRTSQAQTSNFHFSDNVKRSIRHTGRILVDMIPKVYDTERTVRIIDAEDQQKIVKINAIFEENGQKVHHRMSIGDYDVVCDEGPSFQTKRQEAVASMLDLARAIPQQAMLFSDVMVRNMDWPGAREIADRIRRTLPPGVADQENGQAPIPQEVQQQMQQMQNMIKQLSTTVQEQNETIKTKKLELESKERIEAEKLQADFRIEMMRTDRAHAENVFKAEMALLDKKLSLIPPAPGITPEPANAGPEMGAANQPAQSEQVTQPSTGGNSPG